MEAVSKDLLKSDCFIASIFPLFIKSITLSEKNRLVLHDVFLTNKCWLFLVIFLSSSACKLIIFRVMVQASEKLQID